MCGTIPDIPLDDPDRATAAALLDEVMFGDHSNDSANAVVAQALKDARTEALVRAALYFDGIDQSIEIALSGQRYVVTKLHEMAAAAVEGI